MSLVLKGFVSGITTKTKFDKDLEEVVHLTTIKVEYRDLDKDTLAALAVGEFRANLLQMELLAEREL